MTLSKFKLLVACFATIILVCSCEKNTGDTPLTDTTELWPAYSDITEKYGYINASGKMVIDAQYDIVSSFSCGLAYVEKDDVEGFVNNKGKFKPLVGMTGSYSYFYNGLCKAYEEETDVIGYINLDLEWEIPPTYGKSRSFSEHLAAISYSLTNIWGYVDKAGNVVIDVNLDDCEDFNSGLAKAKAKSNDKWGYINTGGEWVIEPIYDMCSDFYDGMAIVSTSDGKQKYINKEGESVFSTVYARADIFWENGLAPVSIDGEKYGYINKLGEMVIEPTFDDAYPFREGLACVSTNGKYGFINTSGEYVISPAYDMATIGFFHNGLTLMHNLGNIMIYINTSGKEVYSAILPTPEVYYSAQRKSKDNNVQSFTQKDTNYTLFSRSYLE